MKNISYRKLLTVALSILVTLATTPVYALPTGSNIVDGTITIDGSTANQLHINQQTDKGIINWQSFNIDTGELTEFYQPNTSSITLNRVVGGDLSSIMGELKANGQIFLVNPNGVIFGSGSIVDVGGLVASTTDISNENFISGNFVFDGSGNQNAQIINSGNITAIEGGLIALVAPQVVNNGILQAKLGKISLASGNKFTLDLYGDELIQLAVNDTVATSLQTQIENSGTISADGGMVVLAASQATEVLDSVINMDGVIHADSASSQNGKIILSGGTSGLVRVNGELSAQNGGAIDILGDTVVIRENANINVNGTNGGGVIRIGGDYQGLGDTQTATYAGVAEGAIIQANAIENGDGGKVIVWADDSTAFYGDISAEGGANSGNGGFVEVSGKQTLAYGGEVSTRAPNGEMGMLLLDPTDIDIVDGAGPAADDAEVTGDGVILGGDGGAVTFTISEGALEGMAAGTNLNIRANNNITIADLADNSLDFATTGTVVMAADADSSGAGTLSMNSGDTITTQGASLQLSGHTMVLGTIDTSAAAGGTLLFNAGAGGMTFNGNLTTDAAAISLTGATTLGANTAITTGVGAGNITINNALDGAFDLSLTSGAGDIIATGNIGGVTPLNSITLSGTAITVADVDTVLGQTYNDPLTLAGTLTTAGANIQFNDTVDLTGASGANTGAGAGDITFVSTLDGGQDFTASAGTGTTSYGVAVGGVTPLANITTTAANISMAAVTTTADQSYNGATSISQNMTSGGGITFTGSAALGANRIITSGGGVGDDIVFNVTLAEDVDVTLNAGAGGDITLGDVDVNSLTMTGDTLNLSGDVVSDVALTFAGVNAINVTGTQSFTAFDVADQDITFGAGNILGGGGNLTLNGDTITIEQVNGIANLAVNGNTAIALNDTVSTVGTQTYTAPAITVANDLTTTNDNILFNNAFSLTGASIMSTGVGIGNITYSGTVNGGQNLIASAGTGDVVALADIGGVTPLTSFTATGTNIDGLAITTTGNQTYTGATTFTGAMTTNTAGDIDVTGALTAGSTISADTTGNIAVSGALNAANTVTSGSGDITVGGLTTMNNTFSTTGGNIGLTGGIALNVTPLLVSTGAGAGNISLAGAIDGATDLTLTAGTGSIASTGAIGGVTPLNSLTATGAAGVSVADVTTTGAQSYTGNTTLNGDLTTTNTNIGITGTLTVAGTSTMDTGAGIGNVTLSSTVDGANSLAITTGTGDATLSGAVGGVTPLTTLSITADDISTQAVSTSGNQTYTGTTTTTFNGTMTASAGGLTANGGAIIDTQAVTTSGNQVYNSGANDTTFNGTITTTAGTLGVTADNISAQLVNTSGTQTYTATTNALFNLALTASAGGVTASGATIDTQAVTTTGNQSYNSTGDTTFGNTITTTAGTLGVTADNISAQLVNTSGTQTYNATTNALFNQNLTATAGGVTASGVDITTQAVTTTGNQSYTGTGVVTANGALAASAGTMALSGNTIDVQGVTSSGNQTYTAVVDTTLNQDITSTAGSVTLNGDVTILANRIITSGGGVGDNITFTGTVDDDFDLTLNSGASGNIATSVMDVNDLILAGNQMTFGGNITSDTALDFTSLNNIVVGAATTLTANSGVDEDITFDALNVITGANNLTLVGDTITMYQVNGVNNLNLTGATANILNSTVSTVGTQTYTGTTTVTNNLTTTNDNILFNNPLNLTADVIMNTGAGAGNITYTGTLNGAQNLTANAGTGNVNFTGVVGGATPLTSLTATGTNIDTNIVTTTGNQTYTGTTALDGDLTSTTGALSIIGNSTLVTNSDLTSGGGIGDDITITGTTTGNLTLGIIAGLADVAMGGTDIDTWNLTSGNQLSLGGTFITDTAQVFTNMGNIVLTADTILRAYNGVLYQDVTFDAANVITGAFDLTIEGNNVELYQVNNIVDLTVTAFGIVNINDSITTTGNQTYTSVDGLGNDMTTSGGDIVFNTPLTLLGNVNLNTGVGGGNILFNSTVDATFDLNIDVGTGTVTALGDMGGITPLNSLTIGTASAISLQQVTTIGAQTYGGPISLGGDMTTTNSDIIFAAPATLVADVSMNTGSGAGNIDFQSTLDGTFDLAMDTGTGDIDFDADVGASARLADVTVTDTHDFTMRGTTYLNSLTQSYGTGKTDYGFANGIDADGGITIDTTPDVDGRIIRAGDTILRATNSVTGEVHVRSLVLAADHAELFGTVNGKTDRDAARLVDLETFTPGPYFMNGFSLPVVGDVLSADTIFNDDAFSAAGNVRVSLNNLSGTRNMLDPYKEDHMLIYPEEGYDKLYADLDYFNVPMWEYIETNILEDE